MTQSFPPHHRVETGQKDHYGSRAGGRTGRHNGTLQARLVEVAQTQGRSASLSSLTCRALGVEKKPPEECTRPCWTLA